MNDPAIHELDVAVASSLMTLGNWSSMAKGAFAANTLRAWKADWEIFGEFCRAFRLEAGVGESLTAQNVSAVSRKVGQWIGLDKEEVTRIFVWSSCSRMPMGFGEKILAHAAEWPAPLTSKDADENCQRVESRATTLREYLQRRNIWVWLICAALVAASWIFAYKEG